MVLTVALGATVAISWIAFSGGAAFQGPARVLGRSWPWIYGSQALLAASFTWSFIRTRSFRVRALHVVLLVLGAWTGELIALTAGGTLLANELDPDEAWIFWLMGTGGPLQPLAAIAGGLLGSLDAAEPPA